jgi:hypothetical protein
MESFPIRTLSEVDLDPVVEKAGGIRAYPDPTRRDKVGADFVLGSTVIELKMLDEEGFDKPGRQANRLAACRLTFRNRLSISDCQSASKRTPDRRQIGTPWRMAQVDRGAGCSP